MITDYVITAIIGAVSAIIVNICYYEYQLRKEKKLEFSKMELTELLLPLYIHLKGMESDASCSQGDNSFFDIIWRDTEIKTIATKKLYLADSKLAHHLLEFLNNQYVVNSADRDSRDFVKNFKELTQVVFDEYNRKVEAYQKKFRG